MNALKERVPDIKEIFIYSIANTILELIFIENICEFSSK